MITKKILMLLVALIATTAFAACGDDDGDGGGGTMTVTTLTVRPADITFDANGGENVIKAQAPVQATATSSADWCTVSIGEQYGDLKITPITVTATTNTTTFSRTATVTITAGAESATVTVTQAEGTITPEGTITKTAQQIAKEMIPGWNLGNTLEATGNGLGAETSWQPTKTSQAVIDAVKAAGFKAVRIPCSWDIHSDANGEIDAQWMARVKQVVNYCIQDGLYVVLNDHWDNGWIEVLGFSKSSSSYQAVDEATITSKITRLKDLWTQIANEFKDYDEHLLFAGLNEPFQEYTLFSTHHAELTPILCRYNQAFVEAVRATGGNNAQRTLVVQGPSVNIASSCNYMTADKLPEAAGRLMVEVHYYDPGQFCGTFDSSGDKAFYYWGAANHSTDHNATYGEEAYMQSQFGQLKTTYTSLGYPVIIGEYAGLQRTISGDQDKHNASVKYFYQCVNEYATNNGIVAFAWDTNDTNGLNQEGGSSTIIGRANCAVVGNNAIEGVKAGVAAGKWPF